MNEKSIANIIDKCMQIDKYAYKIYVVFSENSSDDGLRKFWTRLSVEQSANFDVWNILIELDKKGVLSNIFTDVNTIEEEIGDILKKVERIFLSSPVNIQEQFLSAYWLEYYFLSDAFTRTFNFAELLGYCDYSYNKFEFRINDLLLHLNEYCKESNDVFLICELLKKLWRNTQIAVECTKTDYFE